MTMIAELDQLERKIQAAAKLLDRLREENRELKDRVRTLENAVGKEKSSDWKPKLHALEQERASLLDERRAMARRGGGEVGELSGLRKRGARQGGRGSSARPPPARDGPQTRDP